MAGAVNQQHDKRLTPGVALGNVVIFLIVLGVCAALPYIQREGALQKADPFRIRGVVSERYWILKVKGWRKFNVVVLGNSRANQGVSPSTLVAELPGDNWRGKNLAFNAGGLNPSIFKLAESRLDLDSSNPPMVIMGVTPATLTRKAALNEHYERVRTRSLLQAEIHYRLQQVITAIYGIVQGQDEVAVQKDEFLDDGWWATTQRKVGQSEAWVDLSRHLFEVDGVNPDLYRELMDQTRDWTERGIHVFAFEPPISSVLHEAEMSGSQFDEERFAEDFAAHGGHWIDIDHSSFYTYDNSHLPRDEALRLSKRLGQEIARILFNPSGDRTESPISERRTSSGLQNER